jgi:hypothetical protein
MFDLKRTASIAALLCAAAVGAACSGKQQADTQSSPAPVTQQTTAPQQTATATAQAAQPAATDAQPAAGVQPGAAANASLPSSDGDQTATRVVINALKREGDTVTLRFTLYNDSTAALDTGSRFNGADYAGYRNVSGVNLVDTASKKKYFVIADTDRTCLCSQGVDDIAPRTSAALWAKFPAPPANVQKITVEIPHFLPLDNVPISQ